MKTLYLTDSSTNIVVDKDTDFVGHLIQEDRYDIRSVYYIEEPMHVVYQCGEVKEEIDARKGDILLLFYSNRSNKYHIDTIKTKQWAANIRNRRIIEQKEKEEWAARNAECAKCPCDCDQCCPTCPNVCEEATPRLINDAPIAEKTSKIKEAIKKVKKVVKIKKS